MNEKELKRLKELQDTLIKDTKLSDVDLAEFKALKEKQETVEGIKAAMGDYLKDVPKLKDIEKFYPETVKNEPKQKFAEMLQGIKRGDMEMIKSASPMNETTTADGGYLVPALTEAEILTLVPTFGQARKYMQVMPINGNVLNIPKESTLPTWTWGISENTSITSSKPTLGVYTITPSKGGAIVVLSNELLRDANVNIAAYVMKKIAQAKGTGEDVQFFRGSGSPFTGVFAAGNTFGNTVTTTGAVSTLTYQNMLDCVFGIDQNYLVGASWFLHRTTLSIIEGLLDTQNRPIFQPAFGDQPARIFGFPVVLVENAPTSSAAAATPFIILGNLDSSIIGDVMGMDIRLLTEATIDATSLGQYDLSAIRVLSRVGFTSGFTNKYSIVKTHA